MTHRAHAPGCECNPPCIVTCWVLVGAEPDDFAPFDCSPPPPVRKDDVAPSTTKEEERASAKRSASETNCGSAATATKRKPTNLPIKLDGTAKHGAR